LRATTLEGPAFRLDAKYYQEEFILAKARVASCGFPSKATAEIAEAFVPQRARLVLIAHPDAGAPYLKAHDAFMTRPGSNEYVPFPRISDSYVLREGMLLTPSSGRNLGPLAYVGRSLAGFVMSDIMRILPRDRDEGLYLLVYLMTPTGQALIRRGRTGTNVDHLAPSDVLSVPIVWPSQDTRAKYAKAMAEAQERLDGARETLTNLERRLHAECGLDPEPPKGEYLPSTGPRAFGLRSSLIGSRLDAEFYNAQAMACRDELSKTAHCRLSEAAELHLLGRYKRYYVDAEYGRPILSGTQLLQLFPVNLRHISTRSFNNAEEFVIRRGWTVFTCDGRAEEGLASPAFVSSLWDGWMASNHIMRAVPLQHIQPGFLYLSLRSPYVQAQLKSRATGSVIDALDVETVADVLLPLGTQHLRTEIGSLAEAAWEQIADAVRQIQRSVASLERQIQHA